MPNKKNANYINKPFMLNLDDPQEKELYEWLKELPTGVFKTKTKKYWMTQMRKEVKKMNNVKECETCNGEGGVTAENFGDVFSFECPDCGGTGDRAREKKKL